MRTAIWSFVQQRLPALATVAKDIAAGASQPPSPSPNYPPLNFLANGEPPSTCPQGLAGLIPQPTAVALALAKGGTPEGFQTVTTAGLGIMFGSWSDYCLHCWSTHPQEFEAGESCVLILGRDHGPLNDLLPPGTYGSNVLMPGSDWGETELHNFYSSKDPSTTRLFGALHHAASQGLGADTFAGNKDSQMQLERFIARRRVFVFNVWPWFRSGAQSTAAYNIHVDFAKVPSLRTALFGLLTSLKPQKIACLGAWSYRSNYASPCAWLQTQLWNSCLAGNSAQVEVFRHPSARPPTGWSQRWKSPMAWGTGFRWNGITNEEAFVHFMQ